jgi:protein TonB
MCRFNLLQANTITGLQFQEGGVRVMTAQRTAALTHPYGAYELKLLYNHHLSFGLSSGIGFLLLGIVFFFTFTRLKPAEPETFNSRIEVKIEDIPTPTLQKKLPAHVLDNRPTLEKNAVPVPVQDDKVNPEQTIPEQTTLSQESNPLSANTNSGELVIKDPPAELVGSESNMVEFHTVEILPRVVQSVKPEYPEIARRSMIEGKVAVKVLVGKDGKVRKSAVVSTDNEVFNQSALDAAGKYVFTPGMMNNGPVQVWVTLRFEFKFQ